MPSASAKLPLPPRRALAIACVACLAISAPKYSLGETTTVDRPTATARAANPGHRMDWWRDARFGMFVHWGLYSGLAGEWDGQSLGSTGNMEWAQHRAKVDTDEYAAQALPKFKPKPGFAAEWAKLARQAGCKYLVFTTKHHDGFALHDSKVSEFDAGSVLNRDLVEEIVDACRAEGLRIGFYHSLIDWHHDQFAYADSDSIPHPLRGKPYPNGRRDHQQYIAYLHSQVEELLTGYGPVDILWWDYSVPDFQGEKAWDAFRLIDLVKQHQPQAVMNNRLFRRPEAGTTGTSPADKTASMDRKYGDFMTPEQRIPDTGTPGVDWETCMTMNTTWGYSRHDHHWKSTDAVLNMLIEVASKGGNFLLNIGPTGDGSVPEESATVLKEIGDWLAVNGESIYGASASPIDKPTWGRLTCKPNDGEVFLHVIEWPSNGELVIDGLPGEYSEALVLSGHQPVPVLRNGNRLTLDLSRAEKSPQVTVVRLQGHHHGQESEHGNADPAPKAPTPPTSPPATEPDKRLHADGGAWGYKQSHNRQPHLPRVLLIGDSILQGYRSYVSKALDGQATVDLWITPGYQSEALNRELAATIEGDRYDVIHFNVGLHGWQEGRIKPGTFKPLTRNYVEILREKHPTAKLIWASSTPVTVKGEPGSLHPEINPVIVDHNRMAAEVMSELDVPVNDFYGLLADKLDLARGDSFHWQAPAYKLLGKEAAASVLAALQERHAAAQESSSAPAKQGGY